MVWTRLRATSDRDGCGFRSARGSRGRLAACLTLALPLLSACTGLEDRLNDAAPKYGALPGHKAMVFNADNERLVWVSGKDSQLDAIQLAEILCAHASMDPDECKIVYVDEYKLYDPLTGESYAPDSPGLNDVLYEAGVPTKLPEPPRDDQGDERACFLGIFC
jgi:hypothetical protein